MKPYDIDLLEATIRRRLNQAELSLRAFEGKLHKVMGRAMVASAYFLATYFLIAWPAIWLDLQHAGGATCLVINLIWYYLIWDAGITQDIIAPAQRGWKLARNRE